MWSVLHHHLNLLDSYLWGNLRSVVFVTEDTDVQDLPQPIQTVLQMIRTTPGIFQRVRQSLIDAPSPAFKLKVDTLLNLSTILILLEVSG